VANVVEVIFRGVDQISRNTTQINRSLQTMNRVAVRAGGAIAAAFSVRELVQAADSMQLVENRLKLVTESASQLSEVQSRLLRISSDTRASFQSTVELYARVARSADDLRLSQLELLDLVRGINQAVLVSGATAQEASAGLIQFAQGLASGALRGDELRSVMEQMPRLAKAIADGMGVTVGQLREMGTEGELSASRVARAIQSQLGVLEDEAAQTESTVGQALSGVGDAFVALFGRIDDALGATDFLKDFLNTVSGFVRDIATTDMSDIEEELAGVRAEMEEMRRIAEEPIPAARAAAARFRLEILRQEAEALEAQLSELEKKTDLDSPGISKRAASLQEIDLGALREQVRNAMQPFDDARRIIAGIRSDLEETGEFLQLKLQADDLIQEFATVEEQLAEKIKEIDFLLAEGVLSPQTAETLRERAREVFLGAESVSSFAEQAARNAQDVLAEFLFDPFEEGLDGMLAGFIDVIRRMVAEAAAAKILESLFGKTDENGAGGLAGFLSGAFRGLFGGGKAHGGFTTPGMVHPINEREPEFLLTRGRAEVVPLSKAAASGISGGGAVFAPQTTFQLLTAPLSRGEIEEVMQTREDMLFARFKQMMRDDGLD
jgi:tape measure domain-containing protein